MRRNDTSSSLFNPVNIVENFETNTKIKALKEAIERQSIQSIKAILRQSHALVNQPLNDEGQTAIILALKVDNMNPSIITLLLKLGADKHCIDKNNLSPQDYASFTGNKELYDLLNNKKIKIKTNQVSPYSLIKSLENYIQNYISQDNNHIHHDSLRLKILNQALTQISKIELEQYDSAKLLDLYLTINSVFIICRRRSDLEKAIVEFLALREHVLRGDSHDYCYTLSLANQFCCQLVEIVFPDEPFPLNILLRNAKTQGRNEPWQNLSTLDSDLESPGSFFKTESNQIHLYSYIVERAVANLKRGYINPTQVWFGTDPQNLNALVATDLNILKQRSKTLAMLIEYTEVINFDSNNVFLRFSNLRQGFLHGDRFHFGEEFLAGDSAHIAIAEFSDWWNGLSKTEIGRKFQNQIINLDDPLARIIADVTTDGEYCVELTGQHLEERLSKPAIQRGLQKLSNNNALLLSHQELDHMKDEILRELNTFCVIKTNKNLFENLSESKDFINQCIHHSKDINYNNLLDPSSFLHQTPTNTPLKSHSFFSRIKHKLKDKKNEVKNHIRNIK